mmetsp:Transcript_36639/g.80012  ORF Transcript_36639/g.80012 Transcript_36639/m.80012 type:complete len:385 (-) Transcript_36639:353-1507(-)
MNVNSSSKSPQARLNGRIITAGKDGSEKLLQCIDETVDQMNLVHVSTALHRLARMGGPGGKSFVADPRVARLMARLDETCCHKIHWNAKAFGVASIVLWAVVTLQVPMSAATLTLLRQGILPGFVVMKPQEISNTVTSLHALQGLTVEVVLAASEAMAACGSESSHTCLAQMSKAIAEYGFAIQDCRNPMLPMLEERIMTCFGAMHQWVPRDTAAAAYAVAQGRSRNARVLTEVACAIDKRANHFATADVVALCRALALLPGTPLDKPISKAVHKAAAAFSFSQRKEVSILCPSICQRAGIMVVDQDAASTVLGTDESDTEESDMDHTRTSKDGWVLPTNASVVPIIQSFPNGNANLVVNPQTGYCLWVTAHDLALAQPSRYED